MNVMLMVDKRVWKMEHVKIVNFSPEDNVRQLTAYWKKNVDQIFAIIPARLLKMEHVKGAQSTF